MNPVVLLYRNHCGEPCYCRVADGIATHNALAEAPLEPEEIEAFRVDPESMLPPDEGAV